MSQVYGYSFILTDRAGDAAEIELWQRQRAYMEERVKDAKMSNGLIHLPLGTLRANRGWQAAAVIAVNLVAMLSAVLLDTLPKPPVSDDAPVLDDDVAVDNDEPSHRLATTVRRWMIAAPGRISRSGRRLHLHLPRGWLWADRIIAVYDAAAAHPRHLTNALGTHTPNLQRQHAHHEPGAPIPTSWPPGTGA